MKNLIYIPILFLAGCVTCPDCPENDSIDSLKLGAFISYEEDSFVYKKKITNDSVDFWQTTKSDGDNNIVKGKIKRSIKILNDSICVVKDGERIYILN